jgi:hypothetical protein
MAGGQALKSQRRQQESPVRKRGAFLLQDLMIAASYVVMRRSVRV